MIDERTVELTHQYCLRRLGPCGYKRLILIGSRAKGTARPTSDHDFVAVVGDKAPEDVLAGRNTRLLFEFEQYRASYGLSKIDLLVSTESRISEPNPTPEDLVPYSCQHDGKVIRENF